LILTFVALLISFPPTPSIGWLGRTSNKQTPTIRIDRIIRWNSRLISAVILSGLRKSTFPYIEIDNNSAKVEHEATTSKIGEDQIFYCNQRGIDTENAVALIVNGYAKEVLNKLPMEFAVEAQKLLALTLEGSVG
jgi:hypothetical protein